MPIWRINTLSQQELAKYRQRSQRAINGLNMCKQDVQLILQQRKVSDKYKVLADYMGLQQEGGNSYYNFFVPLNKNTVFLLRNANHDNRNPNLYDRHEQLGRPNKRFIVYFKKGNVFSDMPIVFQDSEHHVIPYGMNALDNETSVVAYIDALIKLFKDGKTTFPSLPIVPQPTVIDNNQELNTEQYMNKKLIRLTEQDLHKIVKESVNRILNEIGDTPMGNFALNAVRGRRAAKRYRANMGLNDRTENDRVMGMAGDTAYKNYCNNKNLGLNNYASYRYGFDKGIEKYT